VYVRRSLPLAGKEEKAKREAEGGRVVEASAHGITLAERGAADNERPLDRRSRVARMGVRYRMLGLLEADVDGQPARLGSPKQRVTLALLLLQPNTVVPAARLVDGLWGDDPPGSATNLVQGYVSGLRKALGKDAIDTRGVGYVLHVASGALDLQIYEQLAHAGSQALERDDPAEAAGSLRKALALWRGPALADLADEPLLLPAIARLEELRVLALERRIEADLALGRHADVVAELEALVAEHPLRERTRGLLMTALYRSGRQAEALAAYSDARSVLVGELGIEPSASLTELQLAILRQDASLAPVAEPLREARRSILVAALTPQRVGPLAALAAPLVREPVRELLLLTTVSAPEELTGAGALVNDVRADLVADGVEARAAVFTSVAPGIDMARLARENDVDLVLVDAPDGLLEDARVLGLLDHAPCDVGVVVGGMPGPGHVVVPFAGADHDWSAVELGAWLARTRGSGLRLVGATTGVEGRDASRLLANASIAVQRALGVPAEPILVEPAPDALVAVAVDASVVVVGLTDRWRQEGLGRARTALATQTASPAILVRRGMRPGGLAPRESETRFTWTVAG
jgi:DNA-binding SARP family transcriptional activator